MKQRTIVVKDISCINAETIGSVSQPETIQYLDTGSITRNKIEEIKRFDRRISSFPSRAQRKVKNGTIVYSTVRPIQEHYGFLENPSSDLIVSTGFTTIDVIDKDIDPKFLYYALTQKSITDYLQTIASNNVSSYPSINPDDLGSLKFILPNSRKEQEAIATVLSSIDSKIELNTRINAELEKLARIIFDYWFVQFDFPDENGKPYKSSGGKMFWNEKLKREIPKGWTVELLTNCCDIIDCLHSKKSDYSYECDNSYLLQLENLLNDGLISLVDKYHVTLSEYKKWTARIEVKENDIVITNAGRVAATAQIPKEIKAGIGRNITAIRPKTIAPTYLHLAFGGVDMYRQIKWNTDSGAFFTSLNVKGIKQLYIIRPNNNIEADFENIVYPLRRQREVNQTINEKLIKLRDWLLPMLMNGQVKIK